MDYINAPGTVVDAQGRRQFANQIPGQQAGTDLDETVFNPTVNEVVHCIEQSGQDPNAGDETQLWKVMAKSRAEVLNSIQQSGQALSDADDGQLWRAISHGRLLRIVDVQWSQTYTPGSDTRWLIVEVQGPGGGGGGALGSVNSLNPAACGGAGAGGGYAKFLIDLGLLPVKNAQLTIGAPGNGFGGTDGSSGGASVFGSLVTCNGGGPGTTTGSTAAGKAAWTGQSFGGSVTIAAAAGLQIIHEIQGQNGSSAFLIPNSDGTTHSVPVPPLGPASQMGSGGGNGTTIDTNGSIVAPSGFGGGGGGGGTVGSGTMAGGPGGPGRILIWELG
ncbi:hypothetical protein [Gluconobacter japonicus]|uniref:glycine-rich domain-containing protein n=1 Tax=Gluconobacter japonicus TaxID=376620 RepID=UPI0039EA7403